VAADELGGRVHHDVGAVQQRLAEVGRGRRVVDDERDARLARDRADRGDVDDADRRVAERLGVEQLGVRLERPSEVLGVVRVDERRLDAELLQVYAEQRMRTAVERRGGDDMIARPVAVASAARPPSSAAMRSSNTATVGLEMRE
jgi:hypothetical protein